MLLIGDCVIGKAKAVKFTLVNTGDKELKYRWNAGAADRDEFSFYPTCGHLRAGQAKEVKVMVRGKDTKKYDNIDFVCETWQISQHHAEDGPKWTEWDDSMKTLRVVRPSEERKIMRDREIAEIKRKDDAELAAFNANPKKGAKPPPKTPLPDPIEIDMSEEPSVQLIDVIPEPEHDTVDASHKTQNLKTSAIIDHASYDC